MTLPTITSNDHPVWKFRLSPLDWWVRLGKVCPGFEFEWAQFRDGVFLVHANYTFDGVSSPVFKTKLDAIPSVLAAALLHDVILQAKRECPEAGITWKDTVAVWKAALKAFNAPLPRILGAAVAFWFNPIFNLLRK